MVNNYETVIGGMKTRFIQPSPILRQYIKIYAFFLNEKIHECVNISGKAIPNGTIDLFFHFNNNRVIFAKDGKVWDEDNFLFGLTELDHPHRLLGGPSTNTRYQGMCITFTHAGMISLLGVKLSELTNRIISVTDLWGKNVELLIEKLNISTTDEEKAITVDDFFISILKYEQRKYFKELSRIFDVVIRKTGKLTVDEIAACASISYRTIHRIFQDEIGLCPKEYLKIVRFDRACKLMATLPNTKITDLVYDCGYFDQAHFINEFSLIMKKPPGEFLKKSGGNFYLSMSYTME